MGKHDRSESEDTDFGQPYEYDENFQGIEHDRRCTDCCMAIFFILFFCGCLALLFVSLTKSNYKYIYIPTDHRGLMCGYDNRKVKVDNSNDLPDLTDKKYLFWVRPGIPGYSRSFCVESCPKIGLFAQTVFNFNNSKLGINTINKGFPKDHVCYTYSSKEQSNIQVRATIENYSEPASTPNRYFCPYATQKMIERCFPSLESFNTSSEDIKDQIEEFGKSMSGMSVALRAVQDVYNTWWMIAIAVVAALVLSILWLAFLRCCAGVFVWLAVILAAAALGALTFLCYKQWKDDFNNHKLIETYTFGLASEKLNSKVFQIFFWVLIAFDVIFVLLVIFLFKKILGSIKVIKFVSKVFGKKPSLFFFPVVNYIIMFVWWAYVIGCAVVLFGAGTPERKFVDEGNTIVDKVDMKYDLIIQGFAIYLFVGFIWVSLFIDALGEMTVAGVMAHYYFTYEEDRDNLPSCMVTRSFFRSLRYHTGSLALGSFIITICKVIRAVLEYIDQKTKNSQGAFAHCVIKCCKCCMKCLEKCLKYLSRNAYIMIAIHGYNFWNGAKNAFLLIVRNCIRVAIMNWVGDFTLFLGRVFVAAGVTAASLFFFTKNKDVQFFVVPAVIVFICSYLASGAFTGVFEIGIDSIFLCFMEDEERNDGVNHKKYASKGLQKFMHSKENDRHDDDSDL
ncbi:hypothetical protein M9Y10_034302 [Tritrichomonas musculus]|uniref:Choline transporter-like protein n=1 Tax=Tritrichomonas musculus TaxID=1915356 RepID=A0ABR2KEL9_9EUKA